MNKQVRVNIRAVANMAGIKRVRRNGRDKIIVPSATMPDDVVMNGIKYPGDEIAKGFMSLNNKPAPLGHPSIDGAFISASDPEGINIGWVGAHNENVRQENGRVMLDKVVDVARASENPGGKALLAAIEAGEPIHTSTGLVCNLDNPDGDDHKFIARNIEFDHDAILLGEDGAATPDQGVGMLVNKASHGGKEIEVINSALDRADDDMDWAVESLARALEKRDQAPMLERMKTAIIEAFTSAREPNFNHEKLKGSNMDKEQFDALSAKVNALTEAQDKISETIAEAVNPLIKPIIEAQLELQANAKAKNEAELAGHVATIIKANILDEESAKELTLNAARKLAANASKSKGAAPIVPGFLMNSGDDVGDFNPLGRAKQ